MPKAMPSFRWLCVSGKTSGGSPIDDFDAAAKLLHQGVGNTFVQWIAVMS